MGLMHNVFAKVADDVSVIFSDLEEAARLALDEAGKERSAQTAELIADLSAARYSMEDAASAMRADSREGDAQADAALNDVLFHIRALDGKLKQYEAEEQSWES